MLKTRVITALCLLAGFLAAVFLLPPAGWAWLVALLSVIAGWEWGGFMKLSRNGRVALVAENPAYPAIDIRGDMELVIWGVVIGKFKRM